MWEVGVGVGRWVYAVSVFEIASVVFFSGDCVVFRRFNSIVNFKLNEGIFLSDANVKVSVKVLKCQSVKL